MGSNPAHENQDDDDNQNDAKNTDATMTEPIAISAEAATKATQQENDK
jgi:hypothetical protein